MVNTLKGTFCAVGLAVASFSVQAAEPKDAAREPVQARRPLDLKAPEISRIFTPQQIDVVLGRATDPALEHIEVEASRIGDLPARDRSASPVEAAFREVVRWFAPYPPALAAKINRAPNGDSYRPVPIMLSSYHPSFPPPHSQR